MKTWEATLDAGDIACVQIRLKGLADDELARMVDLLRPPAQKRGIAVLLNDRPDLAFETGCDGVHIGQEDGTYAEARKAVGDGIVGVTCHNSRHLAMEAGEKGADYVAFGAFFPTSTKEAKFQADIDLLLWPVNFTLAYVGYTVLAPFVAYGVEAGLRYSDASVVEARLRHLVPGLRIEVQRVLGREGLVAWHAGGPGGC